MKRLIPVVLVLALLLALPCAAASSTYTDQVFELSDITGSLTITVTQPTTFWEQPALRSGETITVPGTLTIVNNTDSLQELTLDSVKLPYADTQALEYLNHLHLTVYEGSALLYDGLYSRINDEGGLDLSIALAAGDSVTYTLSLRCDYTYTGTAFTDSAILDWQFSVSAANEPDSSTATTDLEEPLLKEWLITGVLTVAVLAGCALLLKKRGR